MDSKGKEIKKVFETDIKINLFVRVPVKALI
jgi:hypothetical protein